MGLINPIDFLDFLNGFMEYCVDYAYDGDASNFIVFTDREASLLVNINLVYKCWINCFSFEYTYNYPGVIIWQ